MTPISAMNRQALIAELGRLTRPIDFPNPSSRVLKRITEIRERLARLDRARMKKAGKDGWRLAMGDSL